MKALLCYVFLSLLSLNSFAQNQLSTTGIRGTVTDFSGTPVEGCTVHIKALKKATSTDQKGNFYFHQLTPGAYLLEISSVGYEKKSYPVQIEDHPLQVSIVLSKTETELETVIVSAGRTKETIDQIPSSVTVVGLKTLQKNINITTNIADILVNRVPGLAPSTGLSSNFGQTLRGRSLLIMIDGIPQTTPLRNGSMDLRALDPAVVERVEIVKGATAIYGNGAAGGLVNYFTRDDKTNRLINSQTSVGLTKSLVKTANSLGGRVSQLLYGNSGKFNYALSGVYEQTGEMKDAKGDVLPPIYGLGETDSYNAFAKAGYRFNDKHKVQATYNFYSSRQTTNYISVNGDYKSGVKTTAIPGQANGVSQGVKGNHNLSLLFSGETGILNTHYDADIYYQSVDNVFFYSEVFVNGGISRILSKKKGARLVFNTPFKIAKIDANATYGLDVQRDLTSQPLVDGRIWVPEMDMLNSAPFLQTRFTFFDKLILKGGVRYEDVKIKVNDYQTLATKNTTTGVVTESINVKGGMLEYRPWIFNAGLRYNLSGYFSPFVSFSQGFTVSDIGAVLRSAKVNDMAKINTEAVIVDSYEVGFVSRFKTVWFEATGYVSKSSLGANSIFNNGEFVVQRAPERIYGFELEAGWQITSKIKTGLYYSYVEGKVDADDDGSYKGEKDEYLPGQRIAPPMIGGHIDYDILPGKLHVLLQYTGVMNRNRFARNSNNSYDPFKAPVTAYNLFSSAITYHFTPGTSINLGIENMFNEDYFPARSQWTARNDAYTKGKGASARVTLNVKL